MKGSRLYAACVAACLSFGCAEIIKPTVARYNGLMGEVSWKEFYLVPGKDDKKIDSLWSFSSFQLWVLA